MKLALVADLHGNRTATEAVDRELTRLGAEDVWFLGDAVGKGPSNAFTCDWVRTRCTRWVGGNWDYGIGQKQFGADHYYWDQLGEERMAWLAQLPPEMDAWVSGVRFRLFHGRPVTELMFATTPKETASAEFVHGGETYGAICFADSHRPFFRTLDCGYYMNTGSVGNSLGVARAHFILLDGDVGSRAAAPLQVSMCCVPYDNAAEAELAQADAALPHQDAYIREVREGVYSR